jgi:hypothetical protein
MDQAPAIIHDVYVDRTALDIVSMPRGGPDASWLDRRLQTNRLEYLDRDDVDDLKRKVVCSLDRQGRRRWIGIHDRCARMALGEVADVASPKILELGAGLGGLSRKLLETHPTAQVTITDIDPTFVAAVADDLGSHHAPRCGKWTPQQSTPRTGTTTSRCLRCRCITFRLKWPPKCSPKGPEQRASC